MEEGGSIVFRVDADDKSAQQKLNQLRRDIEKTARSLETTQGKKSGIEESLNRAREAAKQTAEEINRVQNQIQQNTSEIRYGHIQGDAAIHPEDYKRLMAANRELGEQKKVLDAQLATEQKEVAKLEQQEQKVLAVLQQQTAQLEAQRSEAGAVESVLAQESGRTLPQLSAMTETVSKSMSKGFKNILKWGFGIRSVFVLFRRLRSYIKEAVTTFAASDQETQTNINKLKGALASLKASWGAAFAPIFNAVAPSLKQLIDWLTAAANAVARFMAVLSGKDKYKKAVQNNNSLASSIGGAGAAAEEAEKQLMDFDEINKLNAQNSGGGGGGGGGASAEDYVEELVDQESFAAKMAIAMKDVLFNWDDLSAESILAKCLAGLTTLGGAFVGGMIGGVPGVIIGAIAGLLLGVALDATVFNFDGKLSAEEFFTALALALPVVAGGVIGLKLGGPVGAAIGIGLGLIIDFVAFEIGIDNIKQAIKDWFQRVKEEFQGYIDEFGKDLSEEAKKDGHHIVFGLLKGMLIGISGIYSWIWNNIVKPIIDAVKTLFGIHSPSKVMEEIGQNVIEGLLLGIKNKFSELWNWITEKFNNVLNFFREIGDNIIQSVDSATSQISEKWSNATSQIREWTSNALSSVGQYFRDTFNGAVESVRSAIARIKQALNIRLRFPHISLPHIYVTYTPVSSSFAKFFGVSSIPHISVQWYARGGIVDNPTLFGAGEAGKEAVIPLERHTEWINMVADSIIDRLTSNAKIADFVSSMPLPALAAGEVVPPRSLSSSGSSFSDGDIQRLVSGIVSAFSAPSGEETIRLYLDGRQIAETVTKHQRRLERGNG